MSSDSDLGMLLVAERASVSLGIVKGNGDGGLGNPSLALLVDELLEISSSNLLEIGDTQNETDGIEDVRFPRPVQTRYRVEVGIEARDDRPRRV